MSENPKQNRPKLTINRLKDQANSPQTKDHTDPERDKSRQRQEAENQPSAHMTSLSSLVDPVCKRFHLEEDGAADLAAFAQKMLSGTKIRPDFMQP